MRRRSLSPLPSVIVVALAAACAEDGGGPVTECVVSDSRGASWARSDLTPLGAEDAALIACGEASADPTSCVVTRCGGRW